ncbi:MAG: hypothetical protein RLZZ323_465 [Bacteroidota bacterium]|jgi:hypothetical protein
MEDYLHKDKTYQIIGILFEVHKNLGKGFSEIVYKDAIENELALLVNFNSVSLEYKRIVNSIKY